MKDHKNQILEALATKHIKAIKDANLSTIKGGGKGEHRVSKTDAD